MDMNRHLERPNWNNTYQEESKLCTSNYAFSKVNQIESFKSFGSQINKIMVNQERTPQNQTSKSALELARIPSDHSLVAERHQNSFEKEPES